MSNNDPVEVPPFTVWTEGILGRWALCGVCGRGSDVPRFFKEPKVREVRKLMCPTCGVQVPINLGRNLRNFMCETFVKENDMYWGMMRYFR